MFFLYIRYAFYFIMELKFLLQTQDLHVTFMQDSKRDTFNIPGSSGIPLWVSNQKMGHQIKIELPMNLCQDNNFLGFVFFFLYHEVRNSSNCLNLNYSWKLLGASGDRTARGSANVFHQCECVESYGGVSDQLWIEYYPKIAVLKNYHSDQCRHLEIFVKISRDPGANVKSCGVHLIYI